MKTILKISVLVSSFVVLILNFPVFAATNTATDPGGGGVSLTTSGNVTVNSAALQLVKQVWDSTGANCLASMPADANCNSSATTVIVPAGTSLKFLIFVQNSSDVALTNVRFQDVLDVSGTGFTYTAGQIKRSPVDATAQLDTATLAQIIGSATTAQTDALGGPDDYASYVGNTLTVGAVTGQANTSLGFPAHRTFAVMFSATKN